MSLRSNPILKKLSDDALSTLFISLTVVFCIARFFNITADFPAGTEMSGVFYTDEGWYCNAAINLRTFDTWYLNGDFNPAVNLPVHHVLQSLTFSLFGMSLASARATVALCFCVVLLTVFFIVKKLSSLRIASFTTLLLSGNFLFFTYSRIAILEMPMLSLASLSLLIALSFRNKHHYLIIAAASLVLTSAALTKSTALFALPPLLYCATIREKTAFNKISISLFTISVFTIPLLLWNYFAQSAHPDDFALFTKINITDRLQLQLLSLLKNLETALSGSLRVQPVVFPLGIVVSLFFLIINHDFRKNPLVHLALIWTGSCLIVLSTTSYHPLRYLLPLGPSAAILFTLALFSFIDTIPKKSSLPLLLCIVTSFTIGYSYIIHKNLSSAESTFLTMAQGVRNTVQKEDPNSIVMGNFANSISLASGIRSINTAGTQSVSWKINTYKPRFYCSLGYEPEMIRKIFKSHILTPAGEWNVYRNYFRNKPVYLFRLDPRTPATTR